MKWLVIVTPATAIVAVHTFQPGSDTSSADVNPNEIAAHIADGTLADWCELWRQQATVAAENLRLSEKD